MINHKPYPYALPARSRYQLHMVPIEHIADRVEFFYKYKRDTENIYIGSIDKRHDIIFEGSGWLVKVFTTYLEDELYLVPATKNSNITIKLFPKLCWLADSFLKDGLTHPVCLHYNPRLEKNVMHPGSTRNHIINLFHTDNNIDCLYFNTGGVKFVFMRNMTILTKEQLLSYPNMMINIAADHCSTIPHINLDDTSVADNIPTWQEKMTARFTDPNLRIYMNRPIKILSKWSTTDGRAPVRIFIADPENEDDIARACMLVAIGKSYKSPSLNVII